MLSLGETLQEDGMESMHPPSPRLSPHHTLLAGESFQRRKMASSAITVLPDPVGAPTSKLALEWNAAWKICEKCSMRMVEGLAEPVRTGATVFQV